ncbi:MAG: ATP-binding protein [Terrimicrobiaceae bacterium]|nr:ATP-binding protein [Terrimicrobiaceae bacterium]
MPHGFCMRWDFWLVLQHVLSDLAIAAAYFSIPAALVTFVRKRRDVDFGFLFWLFSLFIFSCGLTHLMEVYVLWNPAYWWAGWVKVLTALASVATAIVLWRVIPAALKIPTPGEMQAVEASRDVESRRRVEVERAGRLKDDFLATLSHELRTPLNAISGWADLLERGAIPPEKTGEALSIIRRNARTQTQLINELLDLSAIAAGKVTLEIEPTDIRKVAASAVGALTPSAEAKKITLVPPDTSLDIPLIAADPKRLEQVVSNLLANAVKFTPEKGRIAVRLALEPGRVLIFVEDNGEGIAADFLPHVFDRFSQADATSTRTRGGLGIGLALAREITVLHGGQIGVSSDGVGRGTRFTVALPAIPAAAPLAVEPAADEPGFSLAQMGILIVDDDEDSRLLHAEICRKAGASISVAGSATAALDAIRRDHPDVILTDLSMPGYDGTWLLQRIRETPGWEQIPVVAITAHAAGEMVASAKTAGFHACLTKPISPGELIRCVAALR